MAVPILNGKRDTDITDIYLKPSEKNTKSSAAEREKHHLYQRTTGFLYLLKNFPWLGSLLTYA